MVSNSLIGTLRTDYNTHWLPIVSIATATVFLLSLQRSKSAVEKKPVGTKEIPTPPAGFPLVGHRLSLGALPGRTFAKWHKELGPIFQLQLGLGTFISVDDPYLAHKIFVSHGAQTAARPVSEFGHTYYSHGGQGIVFCQHNARFKTNRASVMSFLTPKNMEAYKETFKKETIDLVQRLIDNTKRNGSTDTLSLIELSGLNIVCIPLFGNRFDSLSDPVFRRLLKTVKYILKYADFQNDMRSFSNMLPSVLRSFLSLDEWKWKRFIETERDPIFRLLKSEGLNKKERNLSHILQEAGISEEESIVILSDLVAGTETLAVSICWSFAVLCHHPEVQKKMAAEIDDFFDKHGRLPEYSDRPAMPYVASAIKECLRFKPPTIVGLMHEVERDIEVDGYIIPKDTKIVTNMHSIHHSAAHYYKPEDFIPERFMANTKTMQAGATGPIKERDHFNFGWGRRLCPGINFAEIELFYVFTRVFAYSSIEPLEGSQYPDIEGARNTGIIITPIPYQVRFVERSRATTIEISCRGDQIA